MINTLTIKQAQLSKGFLTVGSGSEVMLIMGSCRVAPLVNYFNDWNEQNGNIYTIHTLDCFNWNWDEKDNRVDYMEKLKTLETDERILSMLKSVDIFIFEFYKNAAMFNCDKSASKNIYQFNLNPKIDFCLPSWNDIFTLCGDIVSFDLDIRKKAIADYNVTGKLSEGTKSEMLAVSLKNMDKFYGVCRKSDIPEMEDYYKGNFKNKRFNWNFNHTSKYFTLFVFQKICDKLGIILVDQFLNQIGSYDMYANNYTYLTEYDVGFWGYDWGEEIKPLRDKL